MKARQHNTPPLFLVYKAFSGEIFFQPNGNWRILLDREKNITKRKKNVQNQKSMAENLRQNIPSISPDPEAYMNGLTRTNSDSSGLTAESSIHHSKGVREGQSMVWTDEKHNLYIDLLEATFVQQLHHSMSVCGHRTQQEMQGPSTQSAAREHNSSDQFMVLQDGCRQKRNYERNESLLDSTADSNDILESHCVHHSSSVGKHYSAMSPQTQKKMVPGKGRNSRSNMNFYVSARNLEQHPDCYSYKQNLGGSTAEALGQNFVNEDQGEKTDSISRAKRLKVATVDPSSSDQVVPLRKFRLVDNSTIIETQTMSKRGKTELQSEEPESSSDSQAWHSLLLKGQLNCYSQLNSGGQSSVSVK